MQTSKFKILIISSGNFFSTYGGGQVYVKDLINGLLDRNVNLSIASPSELQEGIIKYRNAKVHFFNQNSDPAIIKTMLEEIKPDVVHAHGSKALISRACSSLGIPCIVTAHHGGILCPAGALLNYQDQICNVVASEENCLPCVLKNIRGGLVAWKFLKTLPLWIRLRIGVLSTKFPFIPYFSPLAKSSLDIVKKAKEWEAIYKYAELIIAPSQAIAQSMVLNGAPSSKISIVPHGISIDKFQKENIKYDFETKGRHVRFFFLGRICYVKGIHVLLEAFEKVENPAELHLIGEAGNTKELRYMKTLKNKYGLNKRIYWHGKIAHNILSKRISKYDIMVHPSICLEVYGLNIAEALAMGKPVIATKCGGAEMQITNGVNGLLVPPNRVSALSEAMTQLIQDPTLCENMSKSSIKVHSLDSHISKIIQIYLNLCEEKTLDH